MDIKEVAKKLPKFTISCLKELEKDDLIHFPLVSDTDKLCLAFLHQVWGREKYARFFLQPIRKDKRHLLTIKPLNSKVDGYIYSRYYNAKESLKAHRVANEVHVYYGVPCDKKLMEKIKRIRLQAQVARKRHGKAVQTKPLKRAKK